MSFAALASMLVGLTGAKFYDDQEGELKASYPIAVKKVAVEETLGKLEQTRKYLEEIVGSSYKSDSVQRIKGLQEKIDGEIILARKDLESITAEPQFERYKVLREKIINRRDIFFFGLFFPAAVGGLTFSSLIDRINKRKKCKELDNLKAKYMLKESLRKNLGYFSYN